MVSKYRQELKEAGVIPEGPTTQDGASDKDYQRCDDHPSVGEAARVVTRKGKAYQMKVGKIGKAKKPNRRKFGGIAKDAAVPTRKSGQMIPTLTISIALNNPQAAGRTLVSNCEEVYLRAMVAEILSVLDGRKGK